MPILLETVGDPGFWVLFARENERDTLLFVCEWHSIGKRILPSCPPHVHPERVIHPCALLVKRLMSNGLNHPQQLRLGSFPWHPRDKTNDSRHGPNLLGSSYRNLEPTIIPRVSELAKPCEHRFRQVVKELAVQAQSEGNPSGTSQWNVVTRQVNALEPIAFLEVAKTVSLFFSISKVRIEEIRDFLFGAGSKSVTNEHICS